MKLRKYITETGAQRRKDAKARKSYKKFSKYLYQYFYQFRPNFPFLRLCAFSLILFSAAFAQKIAVLVPEEHSIGETFAVGLEKSLAEKFDILDNSLSETAFRSTVYETPFNLSTEEAKNIGAAIGCRYFLLIKSATQRRSAFQREEFYESFAAVYVVNSKTGKLVFWKLQTFEALKPSESEKLLFDSTHSLAIEIADKLKAVIKEETSEKTSYKISDKTGEKTAGETAGKIEEVPDENSPEAKNFRPPLPYKRIKPEYTRLAYIYDVKATIDISVDLDENGTILQTEIVRWAGYGLDESVTGTIRRMNWRPATRNGKTLPMRVLLRYNFKKIEREEQ